MEASSRRPRASCPGPMPLYGDCSVDSRFDPSSGGVALRPVALQKPWRRAACRCSFALPHSLHGSRRIFRRVEAGVLLLGLPTRS